MYCHDTIEQNLRGIVIGQRYPVSPYVTPQKNGFGNQTTLIVITGETPLVVKINVVNIRI
ncbi:hypothetical protein HanRHA438_Chr08g0337191 [Helianthus annuus]|nr:hypothetical protein HanRHA438_Chr08g0337191 [Helianthus annuus]